MLPQHRRGRLAADVADLIRRNTEAIEGYQSKAMIDRSGYRLRDIISDDNIDLAKLIVGSEGTLGIITEATLRTVEVPKSRGILLMLFERLELAAKAAVEVRRLGATACDLMDRRLLRLACEMDVRFDVLLPESAEALLLVEAFGENIKDVRNQLQQIQQFVQRRKRYAFHSKFAIEPDDVEFFWNLPKHVVPSLYRLKGSTRPLPFIEDIAVPPEALPEFLVSLQNVLKQYQVTASMFAHASHGQLHIRPFLDLSEPEHINAMRGLSRALYEKVLEVGGTVSGEHGDGLSRTWFLKEQFGPLYGVFRELKSIFDPKHLLNPGKIVADPPQPLTQNLRPVALPSHSNTAATTNESGDASTPELFQVNLNWDHEELTLASRSCNGCAACRTVNFGRMCPIFRFAPGEESSPRAKANLMRAISTGSLEPTHLKSEELKELADLCVNCHQCRLECPAEVDIPKLMIECKSQYVSANGLRLSETMMARLDKIAAWASRFRGLTNWSITSKMARWLIEKVFGIAQGRKLPRVAATSFIRKSRRLSRPSKDSTGKVLYFVDIYANWFDVELAEAFVNVMEHNKVHIYVHPHQLPSGMSMISVGAVEKAKQKATRNVAMLAEAVRLGYHIVATEPAAALCLTHEYLNLLDDEDARLVAENTSEACNFLWKMHQSGKLELDFKPINITVGHHVPCHSQAMSGDQAGMRLLKLIPGMTVHSIAKGCSGMAGTYGAQEGKLP